MVFSRRLFVHNKFNVYSTLIFLSFILLSVDKHTTISDINISNLRDKK